jgi:hypothetical protein
MLIQLLVAYLSLGLLGLKYAFKVVAQLPFSDPKLPLLPLSQHAIWSIGQFRGRIYFHHQRFYLALSHQLLPGP